MNRLLLDTHALLWSLTEPARLSPIVREAVSERRTQLFVSAASAWELSTKHRLGKLSQADGLIHGYAEHLDRAGIDELAITSRHALLAGSLDWTHRDPFDRMIAAQSMIESMSLVTADVTFGGLAGVRVLW